MPLIPSAVQPMVGTYEVDDAALVFRPKYPFVSDVDYTVLTADGQTTMRVPPREAPPTTSVIDVQPAGAELPRNLLRMYVTFSAPMSEGYGSSCVSLDADDALLPMEPELWDPGRRRLTVLLDPGRIKRGLGPHREAGYPLTEGQRVELVVDAGFLDAAGRPLMAPARQSFVVGPDLRGLVRPETWTITAPAPESTTALGVVFHRPLDTALLAHCLRIVDPDGKTIAGVGSSRDGSEWTFVPTAAWAAGLHHLEIDPILEDVAGNSVSRVFDRDLSDPADAPRPERVVRLDVAVRTSAGAPRRRAPA